MARKNAFNVEFIGIDKYIKVLKKMERNVEPVLLEEYTKYGMLVEEGAKALVHHNHGDLEDSINFQKAQKSGASVIVEGGSNSDYALRRHEEPYRPGVYDKYERGRHSPGYYIDGLGAGTRGKSMWRGYRPGRKYLENAIKATEPDYKKMNEKAIDRILRSKS
ncbi:HK97-gp10 family putative phage morphogenesis protein [Oceanobacillus profundus]|uniref:HK97 gp10 family phage protein n=1 Tax=Oceanobacillus profundus TaxID=372463 RepID=A0A417YJW3_9BACI|nr:HK97 gp10 family phage protein [Oceanobacillus profundus]RHW33522.1 HK97 gp10 family phage protein [Oceanobacillus profundus]